MKINKVIYHLFWSAVILCAVCLSKAGNVIYVAPSGNDGNPGSAEKPLASLPKAVDNAVAGTNAPQEIVIREGVYPGGIKIQQNTNSLATVLPLIIRAEHKKDGQYEDVIIDGGQIVTGAGVVAGKAGVYQYPAKFSGSARLSMWEYDTRIRYTCVADIESVKAYPAGYFSTGKEVLFHTSDGQLPETHAIGLARDHMGIWIQRSNVTIQGLQFRNFLLERGSGGVAVNGTENHIEDCRVWNSMRGFNVGTDSVNTRVIRCRADDVGCGVFSYGKNTIVEGCQFFRKAGPFEVQLYSQDQSGIQCYYPAREGEMRRNLCVGFNLGLFFKCPRSRFLVDSNTIINLTGGQYGIGCTDWDSESVFRYNVVSRFSNPVLWGEKGIPKSAVFDYNCLWGDKEGESYMRLIKKFDAGHYNTNTEPRFKDPSRDDYRLLPDSPGACMGQSNLVAGAFGIADDQPCRLIPPVKDSMPDLAESTNKMPVIEIPKVEVAYVKRDGPPRAWYVDPTEGNDNVQSGAETKPLKNLQFALNHAIPGDRVVLKPGLYSGEHVLEHGGTVSAPITIEAAVPWKAILDGAKRVDTCLTLKDAPYVVIKDLEIRWFMQNGIFITNSPSVTVQGCRFWNKDWSKGRAIGGGIMVINSPKVTLDHNVFFALNQAFLFSGSPNFRLTYNTATKMLHRCGRIISSTSGSVCKNNSFTFTGNEHLVFIYESKDNITKFTSDYNNLAMYIRKESPRRPLPEDDIQPEPNDFFRYQESKGVMNLNGERIFSLREWQKKTGLDKHSIYKHPRYADPENRDFRLKPDSPNIGAGENGSNIGALGVVEKVK